MVGALQLILALVLRKRYLHILEKQLLWRPGHLPYLPLHWDLGLHIPRRP